MITVHIKKFFLLEQTLLNLDQGLNILTGPSGSGKSLVLQALKWFCGIKNKQRGHCPEASVCMHLPSSLTDRLKPYLSAEQLTQVNQSTQNNQWLIEKSITSTGRTQCSINQAVKLNASQCHQLLAKFLQPHDQNSHQKAIEPSNILGHIDTFGQLESLSNQISIHYQAWQTSQTHQQQLLKQQAELPSKQSLHEALEDIEKAALNDLDCNQLDHDHRRLQTKKALIDDCNHAYHLLNESSQSTQTTLHQAIHCIQPHENLFPETAACRQLLNDAQMMIQEALNDLQSICETASDASDEAAIQVIEQQISELHRLSRKFGKQPYEMQTFIETVQSQLQLHERLEDELAHASEHETALWQTYLNKASHLHELRAKAAQVFSDAINPCLQQLGMPHAQLSFICATGKPSHTGITHIEVMFTSNPGHPSKPIEKAASGGELSRIALAIESTLPSEYGLLIFDEADVGVSGAHADQIGKLLKRLSQTRCLVCITHSAQVASFADQHWQVHKAVHANATVSKLEKLTHDQHIQAVAELLCGQTITPESMAHAQQLCLASHDYGQCLAKTDSTRNFQEAL